MTKKTNDFACIVNARLRGILPDIAENRRDLTGCLLVANRTAADPYLGSMFCSRHNTNWQSIPTVCRCVLEGASIGCIGYDCSYDRGRKDARVYVSHVCCGKPHHAAE